MTRPALIASGKLWQITNRECSGLVVCEGSRTKCLAWLRERQELRRWKRGRSRFVLGRLTWEDL